MGFEGKEIMLLGGVILVFSFVFGSLVFGYSYYENSNDRVSSESWVYECSGEVNVKVGRDNSLDAVSCVKKTCGFFSKLGWLDFGTEEEGQVRVSVDGQVQGSENWDSTFGDNQDFTIKTSCVPAGSVDVLLYDDNGDLMDGVRGVLE